MASVQIASTLPVYEDVLQEVDPNPHRLVLWLPGPRQQRLQRWRRVSGNLRIRVTMGNGVFAAPAQVSEFQQDLGGHWRRAVSRVLDWGRQGQLRERYILPTGDCVEPAGGGR